MSQLQCLVSERQCRLLCAAGDTPASYIYLVYSLTCLKCKYHSGINTHTTWLNGYILRYLFKKNKKNVCTRAYCWRFLPVYFLASGSSSKAQPIMNKQNQYNSKKEPGAVNSTGMSFTNMLCQRHLMQKTMLCALLFMLNVQKRQRGKTDLQWQMVTWN